MNIYEKLQSMRVELQKKNIKKTGKNKFVGYEYYELSDILPPINELQANYKTCSFFRFNKDEAILKIVNSEKPDEVIEFTSPMADLNLKGAHEIQNLGGISTYERRYLYLNAFEIVENDYFDAVQGKNEKPKKITNKQIKLITSIVENQAEMLKYYNVSKIEDLTMEQANEIIKKKQNKGVM